MTGGTNDGKQSRGATPRPKPLRSEDKREQNRQLTEQTRKRLGKHYANRYHTKKGV